MATYLPGITDYIPHIQPFRPDYNFYQKALETKEGQYKAGYDKISNLYGTLLNSEMLREPNKVKRDKFFSQVQNDIQRMSSVDLSLEENVDTAYQVFQPIIDDKNITRDMAWTKNYRREKQKGEYFRNCLDPKECGGKWWKEGDQALDYMAQDFSKSDDSAAMKFQNARYTPYVNPEEKAMSIIKELAPDVESVSLDKSGQWIYKTKNGEALTAPLYHYLTGILGNDSSIKDVFDTKAYLARKNYVANNAQSMGGEDQAEMSYFQHMAPLVKQDLGSDYTAVTKALNTADNQLSAVHDYIKKNGISKTQDQAKIDLLASKKKEVPLLQLIQNTYKKGEDLLPESTEGLDKDSLRRRIDGAVSLGSLRNQMHEVAKFYSTTHSSVDMKESPYGKSYYDHILKMKESEQKFGYDKDLLAVKFELDKKKDEGYTSPLDNIITAGKPGVHNIDPTVSLSVGASETLKGAETGVQNNELAYAKTVYENLSAAAADPGKSKFAKDALHTIFGDLLDENYNLKEGFESAKLFQPGASNYKSLYDRARTWNKGEAGLLYDIAAKGKLNQLEDRVNASGEVFNHFDKQISANNQEVVKYMTSAYKDDEFAGLIPLLLKPDGHARTHGEFIEAFWKEHRKDFATDEQFYNSSADAWEDLSGKFAKNMDNNKIPTLKNVNTAGYHAAGGGGMGSTPVGVRANAANPTSVGYANMMSTQEDFNNAVSVLPGEDHSGNDIKNSDPNAKALLDYLYSEMNTLNFKNRKKVAPVVYQTTSAVAADSRNTVGYTVDIDPNWLNAVADFKTVKGQKIASGPAAFLWDKDAQNWKTTKLSFYTPANVATSMPYKGVTTPVSVWDIRAEEKPIVRNSPTGKGGSVTIVKTPDGYKASGYLNTVVDGKLVPKRFDRSLTKGDRLDVFIENQVDPVLQAQDTANQEALDMYDAKNGRISAEEFYKKYPELAPN